MQEFIFAGVNKCFFADGPENYFSRELNFVNCTNFPRNRETFFPAKISSNKVF